MGPRFRGDDNKWLSDASLFVSLTLPLGVRAIAAFAQLARSITAFTNALKVKINILPLARIAKVCCDHNSVQEILCAGMKRC
jgi:hypothetical protein